jgi:beta-N-acetylhexosaminidase
MASMALIIGLAGQALSAEEAGFLRRADVCGVILFTRNFSSRTQVQQLIANIRAVRADLIVCVDQEGGRVQRFRTEFVDLPALALIGQLHQRDPAAARVACALHAKLMATDMLAIGVDLSFAPVTDLLRGNLAIGNRAFSADPKICAELATLYAQSMQAAGMAATLKHFPGHGSVLEDTHFDLAIDQRSVQQIFNEDLLPFAMGILAEARAVMTAHVSYPAIDQQAAGYSKRWLLDILRNKLGFTGVIFSDDVGMAGGANVGSLAERIERHYDAGCDIVLVCSAEATAEVMAGKTMRVLDQRLHQLLAARDFAGAEQRVVSAEFARWQERLRAMLA